MFFSFLLGLLFLLPTTPSSAAQISPEQAVQFSKLSLACLDRAFPYKSDAEVATAADVVSQQQAHPVFFGCYDWHSAVHGHWALVRLLNVFPDLTTRKEIEKVLNAHFQPGLVSKEVEFFKRKEEKRFERAYGYAWFFRLMIDLKKSKNENARRWSKTLEPLEGVIRERFLDYLAVFNYPIRRGVHENSAFALAQGYDFALFNQDTRLLAAIVEVSKKYYQKDVQCPTSYEPEGDSFLSPCLAEADLMRRVLPPKEFKSWFQSFWPRNANNFYDPVIPSAITDGKAVHLIGLDFYKAWTLASLASTSLDPLLTRIFLKSSEVHGKTAEILMQKSDYGGTHWLASFAIYFLTGSWE